MKIQIIFLVALFSILSIQHAFATHLLKHKVIAGAAGAGLLLKPKLIIGGALAGKALVGGALIGKALLVPKVLIAAKVAKKALVIGAGAIVAKKIVKTIHRKKSCRRTCVNCVRSPIRVLKKREISNLISRGVNGLRNGGIRFRNVRNLFSRQQIRSTGSRLIRRLL